MSDSMYILNDNDVIHTGASALMFQCTFKVSEFLSIMESKLEEEHLFEDGIDCDLLSPGQSWQKGKFRIRLEFCPEDGVIPKGPGIPTSDYNTPPSPGLPPEIPPFMEQPTKSVGMWS